MHKSFLETGAIVEQGPILGADSAPYKDPNLVKPQELGDLRKLDPTDMTLEQMGLEPPPITRRHPVI